MSPVFHQRYRIERRLGEGGSAVVWQAFDLQRGTRVALKMLSDKAPNVGVRFVREGVLLQSVVSEHVVQVHDLGVENGMPFMAMELLEGSPLSAHIGKGRSLDVASAATVGVEACRGLQAMHERGIVHRDIKPANLFVVGGRQIKLLDLGISKDLSRGFGAGDPTRTDALLGSPHFMSPEQLKNARTVDARTDIWSLGIVLYIAVTGFFPFAGTSIGQIMTAILDRSPQPFASHGVVAPDIEEVIMRCLEKDPARRFASVSEVAAALAPLALPEGSRLVDARVEDEPEGALEETRVSSRLVSGADLVDARVEDEPEGALEETRVSSRLVSGADRGQF